MKLDKSGRGKAARCAWIPSIAFCSRPLPSPLDTSPYAVFLIFYFFCMIEVPSTHHLMKDDTSAH